MKCPNCERSASSLALRCRICHQRFTLWYVIVIILALAALTGLILLLERV